MKVELYKAHFSDVAKAFLQITFSGKGKRIVEQVSDMMYASAFKDDRGNVYIANIIKYESKKFVHIVIVTTLLAVT